MNWLLELLRDPFYEITAILFMAAVVGVVGQVLKQPLIVMFIGLGILLGPSALDVVSSDDKIHLLAEIGISLLLFIVGLKLDLRLIESIGRIAVLTGLGQVVFTSVIGYVIGLSLGFSSLHSFYIAVALTFSSTIIIVKLLSDKKEIDSLHGQIAIGFLIVQDIVVILVMIVLSALGRDGGGSLLQDFTYTLISGAILIAGIFILTRWLIPALSAFAAKSQELLTLFAIALAITLASVSEIIGFSGEVGAFLAGVSLASSPFREAISGRLVSLRDFLLLFFFINLGIHLDLSMLGAQVPAALVFSFFVLIGNPLIVLVIMGLLGYRKRTSFLAGLTVAQISEFSLIFAGLGYDVGHISQETVGLITLVGLITIGLSTYMILYSQYIFKVLSPLLSIFEKKDPYRESRIKLNEKIDYKVILFGMGRFGSAIAKNLKKHEVDYLGVDFDPIVVKRLQTEGRQIVYGDLEDPELLERIPYQNADYVINTVTNREHALQLVKTLRKNDYKGRIILTSLNAKDYKLLKEHHSDEILMPYNMAAENIYQYLEKGA